MNVELTNEGFKTFWALYGDLTTLVAGVALAALLIVGGRQLFKTNYKSKRVATIAALLTMAWTAEGVIQAMIGWGLPIAFLLPAGVVFEAIMMAAALKAEENRRDTGMPGAAGQYTFVIAFAQGITAAFGAGNLALAVVRFMLPLLAIGLWYVLLVSPRDDDHEEWIEERKKRAEDREATWIVTPTAILVWIGLKRAGKITQTQAQRNAQVDKMVALADTIALLTEDKATLGWFARRKLARARTKLRKKTRASDAKMVDEVAERVLRAYRAEQLMVPSAVGEEPPVDEWSRQTKKKAASKQSNPGNDQADVDDQADDEDVAPVSPGPTGSVEPKPREVTSDQLNTHAERIAGVQSWVGDIWWNGPRPLSVEGIKAIGKQRHEAGAPTLGLTNQRNAMETAACLRVLRWEKRYGDQISSDRT